MKNKKLTVAAALKYFNNGSAPILLEKARGKAADRLIETAKIFGVPVRESEIVDYLVRLERFEEIDETVFEIVAGIYSEIFRLDKLAESGISGQGVL